MHVATEKHGILDISEDIANWQITRRSNAVSSFVFTLQNTDRKYDRKLRPQDRITVELKRLTWVRVFTGSLNDVPIFTAWPQALQMSASCSLKKLQFWSWDPTTTESNNMIQGFMSTLNQNTVSGDGGLSQLITTSMTEVTNWDPKAIHIGAVPNRWFDWARSTEHQIDLASSMASVLGPNATIGGQTSFGSLKLKAGKYGPFPLSQDEVDVATQIFTIIAGGTAISGAQWQDRAATLAITCAGTFSHLSKKHMPMSQAGPKYGWYGMGPRWGTESQAEDLEWSTRSFLSGGDKTKGLLKQKDWHHYRENALCEAVLPGITTINTGSTNVFYDWYKCAVALVTKLRAQAVAQIKAASSGSINDNPGVTGGSGSGIPSGNEIAMGTGEGLAKVAYNLIKVINNPPHILYSQERGTWACNPKNPKPTRLDCSSLVSWCYYHATNHVWAGTNTRTQLPLCKTQIPYNYASDIMGCLLFNVEGGSPEHVAISLGNGDHVAAHESGIPVAQQVDIESIALSGTNQAWLAPGIDYSNSCTTQVAADYLTKITGRKHTVNKTPIAKVSDPGTVGVTPGAQQTGLTPADQLVSILTASPNVSQDIFGGARQLMNNQPFLPWLGNLTNSSMRAWCSAPNGDFIAWFPDYFNVWKTAAIMKIQPIELQDFSVVWSDQQIVTHEYVIGSVYPTFDPTSGGIIDGGSADYQQLNAMLATQGVVTMDFPQIFQTIYGKPASSAFVDNYLQRFGGRPNVEQFPNIIRGPQEFYMALWMFMKHWAAQFNANVPMTFMPELWPGMIIQVEAFGFQAYVTEVTHQGSYGQGGQFTTTAKIIAPAPIDEKLRSSLFEMLDITK